MELTGKNYIAGKPSSQGDSRFQAVNPETGESLPQQFVRATNDEIASAVDLAADCFSAYSQIDAVRRAEFLDRIADGIVNLGVALIQRTQAETGLPGARLIGERARTCAQLKMFANLIREGSWVDARIDRPDPARQPAPKPDVRRMLVPIGPVAVFGASNFPFAFSTAGGDTASALAAGCPVIVKAHPAHPGASEMVALAILDAVDATQMPSGVFSLIHADNAGSIALVTHPRLEVVGFTGSLQGGRALFDAANARPRPIPVFAEMGSVNPVFLLPAALTSRGDTIAAGYAQSLTLGVGQFCTNPGIVVAIKSEALEAWSNAVSSTLSSTVPGFMLTPGIGEAYCNGTERVRANNRVRFLTGASAAGAACFATVSAKDFLIDPGLSHEVFGPFGLLVECDSATEMTSVASHLDGQLTATIHFETGDEPAELIQLLQSKVGRLVLNGFPTGVEVGPAMHHGGPYPASTDSRFTSVGTAAIVRFARPVCYQAFPQDLLPPELQDANPRGIMRQIDGVLTREPAS